MTMRAYRISLEPLGMPGEWVDVGDYRTFGDALEIRDAQREALTTLTMSTFQILKLRRYVQAWSDGVSGGDPKDPAAHLDIREEIAAYVIAEADRHYEEGRLTPADRKSEPGAARAGEGDPGVLDGDGPGGGRDVAA